MDIMEEKCNVQVCFDTLLQIGRSKIPKLQDLTLLIIIFVTLGKLFNISEFLYCHLLNEDNENYATNLVGSCEDKIKYYKRKANKQSFLCALYFDICKHYRDDIIEIQ